MLYVIPYINFPSSNYCIIPLSDRTQTDTELLPGVVPRNRAAEMRFGDWFIHTSGIEHSACQWEMDASDPWQAVISQLINLWLIVMKRQLKYMP